MRPYPRFQDTPSSLQMSSYLIPMAATIALIEQSPTCAPHGLVLKYLTGFSIMTENTYKKLRLPLSSLSSLCHLTKGPLSPKCHSLPCRGKLRDGIPLAHERFPHCQIRGCRHHRHRHHQTHHHQRRDLPQHQQDP